MDFLRLYLGELTGLVISLVVCAILAAIAAKAYPEEKLVRQVRNWLLIGLVATFVISIIPSLVLNKTPRGTVDRSHVDQDQQKFEDRHSGEKK